MKRGFTLLELMIALAVLAIVSMAVFDGGSDRIAQLRGMEQRTLARWIAENEVAKARLQRRFDVVKQRAEALEKAAEKADGTAPLSDDRQSDRGWQADRGAPNVGVRRERVQLGDRTWRVVQETKRTRHPSLWRVEVVVYLLEEGREFGPIDTLVAFIGRY